MYLEFLSREATDKLASAVQVNLDAYRSGGTPSLIESRDSKHSRVEVVPPPDLSQLGENKRDAEATRLIFRWLSKLTPVQASDERLWVMLTHRYFATYVHKRWGGKRFENAEHPESVVLDRWFYRGGGLRTCVHNALSRLWWFGYVTYDQERADPFELTDVLLSLQDIQSAFLERSLGPCRPLLHAVLEMVKKHQATLSETPNSSGVIKGWAKEIRTYGGAFLLDAVPRDRLVNVVEMKLLKMIVA